MNGGRPERRRRRGPLGRWARQWRRFAAAARRLSPYARERAGRLVLTLVLTMAYMGVRLLEPWPLKLIFDHVLLQRPAPDWLTRLTAVAGAGRLGLLWALVAAIIAVYLTSGFLYYHYNVRAAGLGQEVVSQLRLDLYGHIHRLSLRFHSRRQTGDLLVRLTSDIRLLREAIVKLPLRITEQALYMIGMAAIMLWMDWKLALLALLLLPILAYAIQKYRTPLKSAVRKQRRQEGNLASVASDALGAIQVVQGFALEKAEIRRFGGANRRSLRQGLKAARLEAKLKWSSDAAVGIVTAVVVGFASWRVIAGALTPGDLIIFVSYMRAFARPLRRVSRTTEQVARTSAAAERILEILETAPDIRDAGDARSAPPLSGDIRFEGVCFSHAEDAPVLERLDLHVRAGEHVGIVGPTGAGKSTLVSLVPRFFDPSEGRVLVDGIDVRTLKLRSLRKQVSFVFQDPVLFATTVRDNIAAGRRGATDEEIEEAARRAGIDGVIRSLPNGYETELGERGGTLSGGQRQCVTIARCMVNDAPIVILDEPTTGLDPRSATEVTAALERLMEDRTVLWISHDVRRLKDVDRVIVLREGRVVDEGSFHELAGRESLMRHAEALDDRE